MRVPAYSPYAVAEHAVAMLLTLVRRTHKAYLRTKDFNFSLTGMTGFDLHGKKAGIVGMGKIGGVFARICAGFGMEVLAYDKYPTPHSPYPHVSLERVLRESDVISLHCPLTEETYHLIGEKQIGVIDAEALLQGIKSKRLGGACLDVYEEESDLFFEDRSGHILQDDTLARLISMPNVLVTSHQAFLTEEALSEIARTTVENLKTFFETGKCENEVIFAKNTQTVS